MSGAFRMKKKYINTKRLSFFLASLLIFSFNCQANTGDVNFNVTFSIVTKTCNVNNNENITVDFGLMNVTDIDGVNYEQDIIYTLTCDDNASIDNPALKLQFSGVGASFNSDLLSTSERYLGIRLKQRGLNLPMNSWINFTYNDQPNITAVPEKSGDGGLNDGDFSASATFSVEYE